MQHLRRFYRIALDAFYAFAADDGWALASHIALSALLALFPFLIVLTALAGYLGSKDMADDVANLVKFAKLEPSDGDCAEAIDWAWRMLDRTAPAETRVGEEGSAA